MAVVDTLEVPPRQNENIRQEVAAGPTKTTVLSARLASEANVSTEVQGVRESTRARLR